MRVELASLRNGTFVFGHKVGQNATQLQLSDVRPVRLSKNLDLTVRDDESAGIEISIVGELEPPLERLQCNIRLPLRLGWQVIGLNDHRAVYDEYHSRVFVTEA